MLPLSLLVGLATGVAVHDRRTLRLALWVGVVASALFGVVVAVDDLGWNGVVVAAVAFINHVVGMVFGAGLRGGAEALARGVRTLAAAR